MANSTWKYLEDQFTSSTVGNFKKAFRLSQYHDGVLKVLANLPAPDPDDVFLFNRYNPEHQLLVNLYTAWKNAGGQQEGQTLNLNQLLALTTQRLDLWDQAIIPVTLGTKTVAYKALFPNGRRDFNTGSIDSRIERFNTLQLAMTQPALAATKALVVAHYTALDTARDAQSGAKSATGTGSIQVEQQRIICMELQYAATGFLINTHYKTPMLVAPYFELEVLRDLAQVRFTGTLDPAEVEPVLIHTFFIGEEIVATNTGPEDYRLYLSNVAGGQTGTAVVIAAGETVAVPITDFNAPDLTTHRYLTAVNTTATATHYEIEL